MTFFSKDTEALLRVLAMAHAHVAAGWCRGRWYRYSRAGQLTHSCLTGALELGSHHYWRELDDGFQRQLLAAVTRLVRPRTRPRVSLRNRVAMRHALIAYNDARGRTQADVLALLNAAMVDVIRADQARRSEGRGRHERVA